MILKLGILTGALGAILILASFPLKTMDIFYLGAVLCLLGYICFIIEVLKER